MKYLNKETIKIIKHKDRTPFIYFLIKDGKIVYIGQTIRIRHRISAHIGYGRDFDKIRLIHCVEERLCKYENRLIKLFNPVENQKLLKDTREINLKGARNRVRFGSKYKCVDGYSNGHNKIKWEARVNGVRQKTSSEREAAILVDKMLIEMGKEPVNILVRKH